MKSDSGITTNMCKAEWAAVEKELGSPFGLGVEMKVDGHNLTLKVQQLKNLCFAIVVYVDGWVKGEWGKVESEIGSKFWRPRKIQLFSANDFKKMERRHGKGFANHMRKKHPPKVGLYVPYWPSVAAFRRHIAKTCRDIRLVSIGYQPVSGSGEAPV